MRVTLEFEDEEIEDARRAIDGPMMASAAMAFDDRLRNGIKHRADLTPEAREVWEELRALHRECWAERGVSWE